MIHKRIVRYGEYTTKKDRDNYSKDLRGTHFLLGSDGDNAVTTYVYDYRRFAPESKGEAALSARPPVCSGLKLGEGPLEDSTSYKIDYPPKRAALADLDKDLLKDLRASHYRLGNDPRDFETVHRQDYVRKELGSRDPKESVSYTHLTLPTTPYV
eukprot:TRINITY_DN2373_c0_g3_i1.p2 TRINITY_DN2373_c0_g3~~TRINITY_DN2373_c0_g3_i1.p2  ORF type:complete len:155 (+),score=49.03 TRINITY_DN2373_c0_g3_i1:149-613(+)